MTEERYNPDRGLMVVAGEGVQRYTEALDSYSDIFTDISTENSNRHIVDSAWETSNIYYIDGEYVKKMQYDGTELASIQLSEPWGLSVIQFGSSMSSSTNVPNEERGCWVADKGSESLIKLDADLNIEYEFNGIKDPSSIASSADGGCFITDDASGNIIKVDSSAIIEAIKAYSVNNPLFDSITQIVSDNQNGIWITGNYGGEERISRLYVSNGVLVRSFGAINPLSNDLSSSSSVFEEYRIGSIDVDRNSGSNQYIYVVIGNGYNSFVQKYNINGSKIAEKDLGIEYPYLLRVVQGVDSTSFYVISDSTKWDEFGFGSSSSSSSEQNSLSSSS